MVAEKEVGMAVAMTTPAHLGHRRMFLHPPRGDMMGIDMGRMDITDFHSHHFPTSYTKCCMAAAEEEDTVDGTTVAGITKAADTMASGTTMAMAGQCL